MMSDSDKDSPYGKLIVVRINEDHTPKSVQFTATCGCECWISEDGQRLMAERSIESTCMECAGMTHADMILMGTLGQVATIPGQRESLERLYGKKEIDRLYTLLNLREDDPLDLGEKK